MLMDMSSIISSNGKIEIKIRQYFDKCVKDACVVEGRDYNKSDYGFEFIIIKDHNEVSKLHIYTFSYFRYERVGGKTRYRLQRNMEKNFGIVYSDSPGISVYTYESGTIDPNYTELMLRIKSDNFARKIGSDGLISISIEDDESNSRPSGKHMLAYRKERLLEEYYGSNWYQCDNWSNLPDEIMDDWEKYKNLYEKTFGRPIGKEYEVYCSEGLELL